jgi:hypothetical protein
MNLKKADKAFSEYIRRVDADSNGNVKCCTCPTVRHWKEMQCGHYISRKNLSTRFNEYNSHVQCRECNEFRGGNIKKYAQFLINEYDEHVIDDLTEMSHQVCKATQFEIDEIERKYKDKIKEL